MTKKTAKFLPPDPAVQEFVRRLNAKRRSLQHQELIWDSRFAAVPSAHSDDMGSRNFFQPRQPSWRRPLWPIAEVKCGLFCWG